MALKRVTARFLCEALDVANQLAHAQDAERINLSHLIYGAFERLHEYRNKILGPQTNDAILGGIVGMLKRHLSVPDTLPEKNGACQSFMVAKAMENAHRRARLHCRNLVLLEDLVSVLLESRLVMKLFADRDADKDFLAEVHSRCKTPLRRTPCRRPVANRPQFDKRRRRNQARA